MKTLSLVFDAKTFWHLMHEIYSFNCLQYCRFAHGGKDETGFYSEALFPLCDIDQYQIEPLSSVDIFKPDDIVLTQIGA
jgi:hypothetical protein